jgi:hypothetical protein
MSTSPSNVHDHDYDYDYDLVDEEGARVTCSPPPCHAAGLQLTAAKSAGADPRASAPTHSGYEVPLDCGAVE